MGTEITSLYGFVLFFFLHVVFLFGNLSENCMHTYILLDFTLVQCTADLVMFWMNRLIIG